MRARIGSIVAVIAFLGSLSNVDCPRTLRSFKPVAPKKPFSNWSLESGDSTVLNVPNSPVLNVPNSPVLNVPNSPVPNVPDSPVPNVPDSPVLNDPNSPVLNVPKYLNQAEAERVSSARWKRTRSLAASSRTDNATVPSKGRLFYVTNHGADPTGATDSTQAILAAINEAFNVATSEHMLSGVPDLGGVEIHLQGGNYLISRPLRLPKSRGGNVLIHGGTLRASEDFPRDRYLIELWSSTDAKFSASLHGDELPAVMKDRAHRRASYEGITLRDLMLDANFRGGGILVINSVRTNIDNCYISHFMSFGIMVQGGRETYIRNSFLGQHITAGASPDEKKFSGVAISLMSNDNAVTDVVIFSAAVGISVSGHANIFTGVHCYNKATGFGGVGIKLQLGGLTRTRIIGCYMDYTAIVAEDPVQLDIANSLFLGDANIVLKSSQRKIISGVNIVHNMFSGSQKGVDIVRLVGRFESIDRTVVDRNSARGMTLKSTVARGTVKGNGTTWAIDFNPFLLFPNLVQNVQYSFYTSDALFPRHALRCVSHNKVVIEADTQVSATVAVQVDQSTTFDQGNGFLLPSIFRQK